MKIDLPPISDAERTPLVEALLAIIDAQQQRITQLEEAAAQLRDEVAVLKGQKARPKIAPSRLETPPPAAPAAPGDKRPGSAKRSKTYTFVPPVEVKIPFPDPPPGSTSAGYEPFTVQELLIGPKVTRYLRQRIVTPDGQSLLAPLPDDVLPDGHFGPGLIGWVLYQYHHCNVTQPLLLEQLREFGIDISAGQIDRLLTHDKDGFHQEKEEVLHAGLGTASYIGVDDTTARHQGHNGYCTAIGNDLFAYFQSTDSKSRLNFLFVLRGPAGGYAINQAALDYWQLYGLPKSWVARLAEGPAGFPDEAAWQEHLGGLGMTSDRHLLIATEGALLGQVIEHGARPDLGVLSDGAPQFDILVHASCWIHAERPLARMVPYNDAHRAQIERVRDQIWLLYKDLKGYRQEPQQAAKAGLEERFDALVGQKTGYCSIDAVLKEMAAHRADLLRVLERPEVPLHNNASESDIRGYVKTRKISGSTRSEAGRRCRDTFASLKKTCRKLGVSFWAYLSDRVRRRAEVPRLADVIRHKAEQAEQARQNARGAAEAAAKEVPAASPEPAEVGAAG